MGGWITVAVSALVAVAGLAVVVARTTPVVVVEARRTARRPATWLIGVPTLVLILGVGVPYVDAHILTGPPPPPLAFSDLSGSASVGAPRSSVAAAPAATIAPTTPIGGTVVGASRSPADRPGLLGAAPRPTPAPAGSTLGAPGRAPAADPIAGAWAVGQGTEARYGIDDTAMGQTSRVVGRTHDVAGAMQIAGYTVTSAHVVVNMQTVTCQCVHDPKYQQMLETAKYPTSSFTLATPINLGPVPSDGSTVNVTVTGDFTIHGVTRRVTFPLRGTRIGPRLAVIASIPVKLSDYNVSAPDNGQWGGLRNCSIDVLVAFDRVA
jgi:polyisoprenoid-binding protein YceI